MNRQLFGFVLSYVMIFLVIGIATALNRMGVVKSAIARKLIHIGVSNWWLLAMIFFDDPLLPALGAISFIVINYISYRRHLFRAMESEIRRENLGTVYFPISLLVLSLLCFGRYMPPYVGAIGILVLGYGDGMAAIVGTSIGRHTYTIMGSTRSIEGSITMAVVSGLVVFCILSIFQPQHAAVASVLLGLTAATVEALTPYGLDNISVPLLISALYYFIFFMEIR